jgi:hypothetical protein
MNRRGSAQPPPERIFRPTLPSWRELRLVLFFALLSLLALVGLVREGNVATLAVAVGMTVAAAWLAYRGRLLGRPTLVAGPTQLCFRTGRREEIGRWSDIERVSFGPYLRHELWLVRRGGAPIRISDSMTTAGGERFDMVFEDYWKPHE